MNGLDKIDENISTVNVLTEKFNKNGQNDFEKLNFIKSENSRTIILNARGVKYEVLSQTLRKFPNTRLGKIANANKKEDLVNLCDELRRDHFYFDRDPFLLNSILDYYSFGKIHLNTCYCVCRLKEELRYWHIDDSAINLCCRFDYYEKISNSESAIDYQQQTMSKTNQKENYGNNFFPEFRRNICNFLNNPKSSIYAKVHINYILLYSSQALLLK